MAVGSGGGSKSWKYKTKYPPNAMGEFAVAVSTSAAVLTATATECESAVAQVVAAAGVYVSIGSSAVDAGSGTQNAPRYANGDIIEIDIQNLANVYARTSSSTATLYVSYTYYDETVSMISS